MDANLMAALSRALFEVVAVGLVLYVYFAVVLTVLARKTATPSAWMAWVPVANVFLMCRMARRPTWWVLLVLIPVVNLVVIVLVWMGIATARGKPPWMAVLIIVPLLGLLVPLYFASGPGAGMTSATAKLSTAEAAMGAAAGHAATSGTPTRVATAVVCPACGSPECVGEDFCANTGQPIAARGAAAGTAACPICGSPECVGEAFCANTGQPLAAAAAPVAKPAVAAPPKRSAASKLATVAMGLIFLAAIAFIGVGVFANGGKLFQRRPAQRPPQMPARMAGTLTEFPVDTQHAEPARPVSVVTRNFGVRSAGPNLPADSLPPGFSPSKLPQIASSMTTAVYRTRPLDPPVAVHVIDQRSPEPNAAERIAGEIASASDQPSLSGIDVKSPSGAEYKGVRVRTADSVAYVLGKLGASVLVLIFAKHPEAKAVADRLAASVGNGGGLNDDPEVHGMFGNLPAALPKGVELEEANVYSAASLTSAPQQLQAALGGTLGLGPELNRWIEKARRFIPQRLTQATYSGPAKQPYKVLIGDYGSSASAWSTWMMVRVALAGAGTKSVQLTDGSGVSAVQDRNHFVLFQKGSHIVMLVAPQESGEGGVLELANALQF